MRNCKVFVNLFCFIAEKNITFEHSSALIRQGIFSRKHSVDLLDGLDLDFLTMDNAGENLAEFDSFGPDEQYSFVLQFGNKHLSDQVLDSADDGNFNAQPSSSAAVLSAMDGDWFDSHVDATIPRTSSIGGSNFHLRKNSLLSGDLKGKLRVFLVDSQKM